MIKYAAKNSKSFYLSNDDSLKEKRFEIQGDKIYIHSYTFQNQFYESACSNVEAFLINHENIGKELREDVINNATAEEITKRFFELFQDKDSANFFLTKLSEDENFSSKLKELIKPSGKQVQNYIAEEGIKEVLNPLTLGIKEEALNWINISILESHLDFINDNLNQGETFFREWITGVLDCENNKETNVNIKTRAIRRNSRCLIFGLDYMKYVGELPKDDGRLDLIASRVGGIEHVIIEMKSPTADVFDVDVSDNINGGGNEKYSLSKELARAIPQVLGYRKDCEVNSPCHIKQENKGENFYKCIIVIGQRGAEADWEENFILLKKSLSSSLEIWTYTDLIEKLETTIQNLKNNL